jgi:hypothetical protein
MNETFKSIGLMLYPGRVTFRSAGLVLFAAIWFSFWGQAIAINGATQFRIIAMLYPVYEIGRAAFRNNKYRKLADLPLPENERRQLYEDGTYYLTWHRPRTNWLRAAKRKADLECWLTFPVVLTIICLAVAGY